VIPTVTAADVPRRIASGERVVDVRSYGEWQAGHVAGATLAPMGRVVETLADVPRDQPLVVLCESGSRSAIGASLLQRDGFTTVTHVDDGMSGWRRAGLPVEVEAPALTVG
jgi:hydroxyacylglutathione hydrolase